MNMTYELMDEKALEGIEFSNRGERSMYPFAEVAIGGGFKWPDDKGKYENGVSRRQNLIGSAACSYVKKYAPESKFTTTVKDGFVYVKRIT
jgi:hypothetical protein